MNWYPVSIITKYHKLGNSKQQKLIFSQFWCPAVQNQYHGAQIKGSRAMLLPETLEESIP